MDDTTTSTESPDALVRQLDGIREKIEDELARTEDRLREAIRDRPLMALAAAVAGGFLVARIVRR